MAFPTTIFDHLRSMRTDGRPLSELIAEACDVGTELLRALEKIAEADNLPPAHVAYLSKTTMAEIAERAAKAAYRTNGHTPENGARAA